jgi:type III secretory pathway component EscR
MEVYPIFHEGIVVHLYIVLLECLKSSNGLVVLSPRFRVETLKDSWKSGSILYLMFINAIPFYAYM